MVYEIYVIPGIPGILKAFFRVFRIFEDQGPIPAYLYADSGFMGYTGGIYTHGCDNYANHAITVVGYGPDYWNCLNSWGDWWGDGGTFKVGLCVLTDFQLPGEIVHGR